MQYKLVVDKQSRLNPSTEKKIYTLDIEELRAKGNISDKLIISPSESYVIRNLSLSEYHVLKVLENPIKEVIENPKIELFEGDNYIYLIDMVGNRFYAEYLIKNEFNDVYPTKTEMHAAINLVENAINLEVAKKVNDKDLTGANLLLRINGDKSEAKLKADKIGLEGYTTINNGFSVDTEGNASIANNAVKINRNGIQMADGTKIVGGDGMLSNFQFLGTCHRLNLSSYGKFDFLGVVCNQLDGANVKSFIDIYADIPAGFTITEAYITLIHQPVVYSNDSSSFYGYSRNLGLYQGNPSSNIWAVIGGEYYESSDITSEIVGAFGSSGFTPSTPSSSNLNIETKKSINLKNYLTAGSLNRFVIQSRNDVPDFTGEYLTDEINCAKETGRVLAILEIYGFMKII